jgi:threonylcarbamoyladenosine tRNA methylthiotransferase MtaB
MTLTETSTLTSLSLDADVSSKTVAFYALGCRANQLEASALADEFRASGWEVLPFEDKASLYVINTCTVTHGGDSDSRRMIRRAVSRNPQAKVAVTGCYAQVSPEEVAAIEGVDFVIGNNFKQDVRHIIEASGRMLSRAEAETPEIHVGEMDKSRIMLGATASNLDRSRASLKIQDGCDFQCTYCIIWVARGKSRSLPMAVIEGQLKGLLDAGYQEIVLTGINIGQYEDPNSGEDLTALLARLISVPGDFRLRLSSLDPFEVTSELISLVSGSKKLCAYFHLSMQSAEDSVLKRMARRHHVQDIEQTCLMIKQAMPHAAIGADIIVGFPGETDACFETTYANLERLPVDMLHVFSYSKRKDTPAAEFDGQVNDVTKKQRSTRLMALSAHKKRAFYAAQVGRSLEVLVEGCGTKGISENYVVVKWAEDDAAQSKSKPKSKQAMRVIGVDADAVWAESIDV